jgi:diguanylate cyclase (GGDEF)-like protein
MGHRYNLTQQFILNDRWLFDVAQCRLLDLDGRVESVTFQPVAARILSLFVQAPRIVQHRRQLFEDGWRAFGFEVCENSLNQVMHALRSAFEQLDPGRPYIKTVPRIGYCLLADVRLADEIHRLPSLPDPATRTGPPLQSSDDHRHRCPDITVHDAWCRAHENGVPLSLLLIEVDQPEYVNSLDGHSVGDALLSILEQRIRLQLHRSGDGVVQHDRTTFMVSLPQTDQPGAMQVAQRIRDAVQALERCSGDGSGQPVTVRIGLNCTALVRFETSAAFVEAAHTALHEAMRTTGGLAVYGRGTAVPS